ncbi:uncharacterized protein LOC117323748 [Pecten maximus]|uniref:uncharacterized protein LOC117323748 n=1 Tax=Pecten maximus TaxID=6579 RepID=UPI001458DC33|nr:uncharacterized protein LOC117323748 [Pecten maximus]
MVADKENSEVRNSHFNKPKNNTRISSSKKRRARDRNHVLKVITIPGYQHRDHSVLTEKSKSETDVTTVDVSSNSDDRSNVVVNNDSGRTIENKAERKQLKIQVDLRLELCQETHVSVATDNETDTSENERDQLTSDNKRDTESSNSCNKKSIIRKDSSLDVITEEKETGNSQNVVKKESLRREITFDELVLDDSEILRTSTPTGNSFAQSRIRPKTCSSVSKRKESFRSFARPKSSLTPRTPKRSDDSHFRNCNSRSSLSRSDRPSTANTSMSNSPRRSIETRRSFKITKEDLEHSLPKKSFFNCHDKVLKDAGFEVEEVSPAGAKKRQFMQLLQQRNKDRIERDKARKMPPPKVLGLLDLYELECSTDENSTSVVSFEDQQSKNTSSKNKKNSKSTSKKKGEDEEDIRVDYQLLLIYLKYIKANPEEFLQYHERQAASVNLIHVRHGDSLVKLGSIFQRGRHGISTESILVKAVHDIRPRFTDPGQWASANKEKELLALTSTKKENSIPTKQEPTKKEATNNQEEPKTEYERIKLKLDGWLKTVTTAQLNKAKELALRELGQEDVSLSRWWISLKSCNYIRQRTHKT